MKKILKLLIPITLLVPSFFAFESKNEVKPLKADSRPTYNIPLLSGESLDYENEIFDDFDHGVDSNMWWLNKRQWANANGRKNGGVMPENIFYDEDKGTVLLRTAGDYYAENNIRSPEGALATEGRRSGADLVSKFLTYPGRYEVRMKVAPRYGVCTTMWTYIEYGDYIANLDGRHNHEIDIELPWNGDFKKVSFGNYVGGFDSMHTSEKITLSNYLNDDEFHTFGFDWYYNDNTNHKVIRYYIDGEILSTIDTNVPFYKTKVNIGIWIPDSGLAALPPNTAPLYDQAYAEIDYFKYIPFLNNHHEDATAWKTDSQTQEVTPKDPYEFSTGAPLSEYPSVSTPNIKTNYFPNGSFNYVNKLSSSYWLDQNRVGIENSCVEISKTTYDRNSSPTSGGANISNGGYLAGYIDSCYKGQKYNLSLDYRYQGQVRVMSYDANDSLLSTQSFDFEASSTWNSFSENITLNDNDVKYICVAIFNNDVSSLWIDNISLTRGHVKEEIKEATNHFMTIFHNNPAILSALNTTSGTTSSRLNDVIINNADYTSDISWRLSSVKYEAKSSDAVNSLTLAAVSSDTISGSSDIDYQGIYNCVSSNITLSGYQSIIHSTSYIQDLTDISLSWGSCESGEVAIAYKFKNDNWQYLTSFIGTSFHSGTNDKTTWNRRQLIVDSTNSVFSTNLLGETAKIAFLYSSQSDSTNINYIRMNSIIINKVNSIKAKINHWSENNFNLCGGSGKLFQDKSLEKFDLLMTNYCLTDDQANLLNSSIDVVGSAKEATYYDEYRYLCNVANINVTATPSNSYVVNVVINSNNIFIVLLASTFGLVTLTGYIIFHKRKR